MKLSFVRPTCRDIVFLTIVAVVGPVGPAAARVQRPDPPFVGEYQLRIRADSTPIVFVEAELDQRESLLVMATGGGIDHLPNQWATFVRDIRATDQRGRALTLEARGPDGWRIVGGHSGRLRLTYQVDLGFTTQPWPPGNEQAGIWMDSILYVITKPLFVGTTVEGRRRIVFTLPSGWRLSTSWEPDTRTPNAFSVGSNEELMENSLVAGRHLERRFVAPSF